MRLLYLATLAAATVNAVPAVDESKKYWPGGIVPRDLDQFSVNESYNVFGVRKMGRDEGEKFFHHYWGPVREGGMEKMVVKVVQVRQTMGRRNVGFKAPARVLDVSTPEGILKLFKRQNTSNFQCPAGTLACTNIQRPGSCCEVGETCWRIEDSGLGDVGCCPDGSQCEGSVSDCGDKQACSREEGGGCCIAGTKCSPNGCIPDGSGGGGIILTSNPATTASCTEGFYACPATLGGGCCRTGRACGISECPPLSGDDAPRTNSDGLCPTGFYSCAPQFNGGCCRVGRDCGINSCPLRGDGPTTVTDGVSPTETAVSCPQGWYGCAAVFGGGCCPLGYNCAMESCPAQNDANAAQRKIESGEGFSAGSRKKTSLTAVGAAVALCMGLVMIA